MNILCIGDPHSDPDTDQSRFDVLGNFLLEKADDLDYVVCMGDFANLNSLSSYDKNTKTAWNRFFNKDCQAAWDANRRIFDPIHNHNNRRSNLHKRQLRLPRLHMLLGNHEDRIDRAVDKNPELYGFVSIEALRYEEAGWQVTPYLDWIEIENVFFSHFFPSGIAGRPISGFNIAGQLLIKNFASSIVGHSHIYDYSVRHRPNGESLIGLSVGWFGDEPTFKGATENLWWSGLVELRNVKNGNFDVEQWSMERLKKAYS